MKNAIEKIGFISAAIGAFMYFMTKVSEKYGGNTQLVAIIGLVFLIIALVILISNAISKHSERVKDEERQRQEKYKYERRHKRAVDKAYQTMKSLDYECVILNTDNDFWMANGNIYNVNFPKLISFCLDNPDMNDDETVEKSKCFIIIPVDQIICFYKEGDAQYTTKVSGGGGGGSSLTGALAGGLIAGGTGAIIGSRKKNEEIKSTVVTAHNDRKVVIRYNENGSVKILSREDKEFEIYEYLLKKIPEKDLLTIQMNQTLTNNNTVSAEENTGDDTGSKNQDISERLQKLQNLYDSKLITESEYTSKRQDILDSL